MEHHHCTKHFSFALINEIIIGMFPFQSGPPANSLLCIGVCYGVCFLLSGSHLAAMFTSWGSTIGVCDTATVWSILLAGIYASSWWSLAHVRSVPSGCFCHCFELGGFMLLIQLFPSCLNRGVYSFAGSAESPDPSAFPTWWGGVFFSR